MESSLVKTPTFEVTCFTCPVRGSRTYILKREGHDPVYAATKPCRSGRKDPGEPQRMAYLLSVWVAHQEKPPLQRTVSDAPSAATGVSSAPSAEPERMTDDPNLYLWAGLEHAPKEYLPRG